MSLINNQVTLRDKSVDIPSHLSDKFKVLNKKSWKNRKICQKSEFQLWPTFPVLNMALISFLLPLIYETV